MTYQEYESLYQDELVTTVREVLQRIEDNDGFELEDSQLHNRLTEFFNRFRLHQKLTEEEFKKNLISTYETRRPDKAQH